MCDTPPPPAEHTMPSMQPLASLAAEGLDAGEAVDPKWGGELPFSVLYDRSGKKVRVYSGSLPVAAAEKEIRRLLAAR